VGHQLVEAQIFPDWVPLWLGSRASGESRRGWLAGEESLDISDITGPKILRLMSPWTAAREEVIVICEPLPYEGLGYVKSEATSTCQNCGARVPAGLDFCPVCALRGAVGDAGETSPFDVDLTHSLSAFRFDHYEILTREDGTPLELGRGAMGVTYKTIDTNLQCAVALKVINTRLIGDESARRRFVREARAAASVRHPNVASVFHLGQSGDGYFYAMEFVEGETLENVIKRTGQLELKLVLQIAAQVAGGLAAVHKQNLVHRDIKPSNIMVSLEEGGNLTAKIIDLGLAKVVRLSLFV
jgi:hypothetical protein